MRKRGDSYRQQNASSSQHAARFTNRFEPLVRIRQVVEWPEEEHRICCFVGAGNCARIPYLKASRYPLGHCGSLFSLLDMQRHRINEIHHVTPFR